MYIFLLISMDVFVLLSLISFFVQLTSTYLSVFKDGEGREVTCPAVVQDQKENCPFSYPADAFGCELSGPPCKAYFSFKRKKKKKKLWFGVDNTRNAHLEGSLALETSTGSHTLTQPYWTILVVTFPWALSFHLFLSIPPHPSMVCSLSHDIYMWYLILVLHAHGFLSLYFILGWQIMFPFHLHSNSTHHIHWFLRFPLTLSRPELLPLIVNQIARDILEALVFGFSSTVFFFCFVLFMRINHKKNEMNSKIIPYKSVNQSFRYVYETWGIKWICQVMLKNKLILALISFLTLIIIVSYTLEEYTRTRAFSIEFSCKCFHLNSLNNLGLLWEVLVV
ncbi:putative signal peptide protein [Puccinia sorghi]|uniref:Putative signal peptide protein n=1 Tax=Puccinia sorghi TaxID=27349 RepID=A0A0L6VI36_9BASI|nr:putative signal peptide protein [Puccinia sorghi]